ncbi:MAG: hypothetical protein K2O59_04520 [Lachnospiraceae bacterium]|nr:hypothetical protein [Lachnospiraceae bacterium]
MRKLFPTKSKKFGDRLNALMTRENLSSLDLAAKLLGYSKKPKSNTEEYGECRKKERTIKNHLNLNSLDNLNSSESLSTIYLIEYCNFFHCSADYLLGFIDFPTQENQSIYDITGLNNTAINTLSSWFEYERNMKKDYQEQIYFPIETLNTLLSDDNMEWLLRGIQDLLKSNYKIPAYHNGEYETVNINKKYSNCLTPKYIVPDSDHDVIKGHGEFSDLYLLTLVQDKEKTWDHTQIVLDDDFFEAVAMKTIEKYLREIRNNYLEEKGNDANKTT